MSCVLHISVYCLVCLRVACDAATFIQGDNEKALYLRRTLVRYLNLCHVLVLRDVSKPVRMQFPSFQHLIDKGYMTEEEVRLYHHMDGSTKTKIHNYWIPWQWACSLVVACRKEGFISSDAAMSKIYGDIQLYKKNLQGLVNYDWITIPLCYTQVVTIAVYTYFLASLVGRQYLDPGKQYSGHEMDFYFPFVNIVEFFFYMGWLKVAESLINPLGDDDQDFDTMKIIHRNFEVLMFSVNICTDTSKYIF
ncbi:unnamed protein product [Soboliphyme baturini]|uniref:Bestrophin homolog n=1 Tax=Soboliphyme baturini TaxID=241478 RepID=A0A183J9Z4_9BILA|nr:unnamed protein product [Soboliphyme baturini]